MKTLVIVRHGAFSHSNPAVLDVDRPLNLRGRHEAVEAAGRFAALGIQPELILSSPARRVIETTGIWNKKLKLPAERLQVEPEIYEAERAEILRIVHRQDDSNDIVMVVGHNPVMTSLLHHLVDSNIAKMPSSSFAVVELAVNSWRQVSFKTASLTHYSAPAVKDPHEQQGWLWHLIFWSRQKVQKIELFLVFLVGLLVILGLITMLVRSSTDSSAMPVQGSMGRNYNPNGE